jgi:hypothetical protein
MFAGVLCYLYTTSEGGERRKKKAIGILCIILLLSVPLVSATHKPQPASVKTNDTTILLCIVDGNQIKKEMPLSTIQTLIDMGKSCKEDFLTIYDTTKSDEDVTLALESIKPFFQALKEYGLTEKTVDEFNMLYYRIREKIRQRPQQSSKKPHDGPQPLAIWNGLPTPIWANMVCGQFDVGICSGFAGGTHLIIPTIGADVFLTYAFEGTSITVGAFGYTIATAGFNFVLGFIGIILVLPIIMLGPYFLAGMSGLLFGVGV